MGYSQINSTFKKKLKRNPGEAPIRAYINPKREAHSTPLLTLCAKRLIVTCGASPVLALLALCRYYMCSFFFTCFEKNKKKQKYLGFDLGFFYIFCCCTIIAITT